MKLHADMHAIAGLEPPIKKKTTRNNKFLMCVGFPNPHGHAKVNTKSRGPRFSTLWRTYYYTSTHITNISSQANDKTTGEEAEKACNNSCTVATTNPRNQKDKWTNGPCRTETAIQPPNKIIYQLAVC
jgi:hypothetical protein